MLKKLTVAAFATLVLSTSALAVPGDDHNGPNHSDGDKIHCHREQYTHHGHIYYRRICIKQ